MMPILAWLAMQAATPVAPVAPTPVEQARTLVGENRAADAIALLRTAVRASPADAMAHNMLGALLNREGHYPEALIHAEQAARLAPDNPRFRYNRGIVRVEHGRMAEALEDFDAAIAALPDQAPMQLERGAALLALGRSGEARTAWSRARQGDPALVWADWYEGLHDLIDGKPEAAIAKLDRVAAAQPDFANAQAWLILAHLRAGTAYAPPKVADAWVAVLLDYHSGQVSFERLLAEARADRTTGDARRVGEAWLHHGFQLAARDKTDEAREAFLRANGVQAPRHAWKLLAERAVAWFE